MPSVYGPMAAHDALPLGMQMLRQYGINLSRAAVEGGIA